MDCLAVQEILSAAFDGQPTDPAQLRAAEEHCSGCAECQRFASALRALARLPAPEPPEGFEERVIRAVREAQATVSAGAPLTDVTAASLAPGPHADRSAATAAAPDGSNRPAALIERLLARTGRRALALWATAAAAMLIAAGFLALWGARQILAPPPTRTFLATEGPSAAQREPGAMPQTPMPGESEAPAPEQGGPAASSAIPAPVTLIVVDGAVHRSAGRDDSVQKSGLTPAGTVRAALREGGLAADRTVLRGPDPTRVYVEDDDGSLIAFERVTMSYQGRTYVLQSEPLERFGALATLPRRFTRPVAPDGSPTFEPVAGETGPLKVFVAKGRDASFGIALPPGARPDVAEGWSWWAPASP